jgi:hypothetical protein
VAFVLGLTTALTSPTVAQPQGQGEDPPSVQVPAGEDASSRQPNRDDRDGWRREWRRDDDEFARERRRSGFGRDFGWDRDRRGGDRDQWREGERRGERWGEGPRDGAMPGSGMQGPGMMAHGHMMLGLCGPRGGRRLGLMLDRLERITRPTEEQRALFDKLTDAAGKAVEIARAGCPAEQPLTPPGRLASAEKRLDALLQAVRTVRPAMDEFYGSLNEEQKARLYLLASHRPGFAGGWRERRDDRGFGERRPERWRDGYGEGERRPQQWGERRREREPWSDGERGYGRDRDDERGVGGRDYDRGFGGRDYDRDGWIDPWRGRM